MVQPWRQGDFGSKTGVSVARTMTSRLAIGNASWTKLHESKGFSFSTWGFRKTEVQLVHAFPTLRPPRSGRGRIKGEDTHCDCRVTGERISRAEGLTWKSPLGRSRCSQLPMPALGMA